MNKNVFYIEKEKFLRSMFEVAFKQKNVEIYTIDSIKDNFYLLDDLKPRIIIFDLSTVGADLETLLTFKKTAYLIATGSESEKEKMNSEIDYFLAKPIIAHNLVANILKLATASNHN